MKLANREQTKEAYAEMREWWYNSNFEINNHTASLIRSSVAEFILNKQNLTMRECKTYESD